MDVHGSNVLSTQRKSPDSVFTLNLSHSERFPKIHQVHQEKPARKLKGAHAPSPCCCSGETVLLVTVSFQCSFPVAKGSSLQLFIMLFHLEINRQMQNGFKLCFREPEVSCSLVLELLSSHKRFYYFFSGPQ